MVGASGSWDFKTFGGAGSGIWDLGSGTWDLGSGIWDLGSGRQRGATGGNGRQREAMPGYLPILDPGVNLLALESI